MLTTRWLLLPLVVLGSISPAYAAGTRLTGLDDADVEISPAPGVGGPRTASGALGTVRLEPAGYVEKEIGCELDVTPGLVTVICIAKNAAINDWTYCISTDPDFISAMNTLNGDSKITFVTDPANRNHCQSLIIENSSKYQQKAN